MGVKLRTFRFCFDLSMCLARFHAWFPHQLQRIRLMEDGDCLKVGGQFMDPTRKAFPSLGNFRTQNCISISEVATKSLTKNSYFQQMNGVQNSIPTPFSEGKIVQIMQILKFSHGLTHRCNKHLEFEAQKLRHHDHHAVFIGRILPSWHGNRAWNYSKYTDTHRERS